MTAILNHPAFPQPNAGEATIWRYSDFAKLVAMLQTRSLYFARVDQLKDPFEGTLSKVEFEHWKDIAAKGESDESLPPEWRGKYFDVLMRNARVARYCNYVSCWHLDESESEAMWQLYASSGYAIAVQSTYTKLASALPERYLRGCYMGLMRYADHHSAAMPDGNIFYPIMHKRLAFAHEREVRVVIWAGDPVVGREETLPEREVGLKIPVRLDDLIDQVIISPLAEPWFAEIVSKTCAMYGLTAHVTQSELVKPPYI